MCEWYVVQEHYDDENEETLWSWFFQNSSGISS